MTSDERLEWARQRSDNPDGTETIRLNPLDNTQWEYMGNRNWTNYFLDKSTFSQAHQLSISGATEKTKFYLSGGVDSEDGVFSGVVKMTSIFVTVCEAKLIIRFGTGCLFPIIPLLSLLPVKTELL